MKRIRGELGVGERTTLSLPSLSIFSLSSHLSNRSVDRVNKKDRAAIERDRQESHP